MLYIYMYIHHYYAINTKNIEVDENNNEVELSSWNDRPVYVKYNSTDNGDAYMKPYNGEYYGVLYQPVMQHAEDSIAFAQYGDFPLLIFRVPE
jgi:hypothetical protein